MAPPQLTADAPVVHVVDPAEVPGVHLRRVQPDAAVADRVAGRLGERPDADEPLQRLARLDRGAAPAAVADRVHVRADLGDDPALLAQRAHHGRPGLEPVQALERAVRGDHAVLVQDGQAGQAVTAADLEVVRVMGRGHLDRAGAERGVDVLVGDDRDAAAGQRQLHRLADQMGVARRRPGAPRRRCRRAWSRPGWWRPRSSRHRLPYRIEMSSPSSSLCSTSMSDSAVRQRGHQLMIRSAR